MRTSQQTCWSPRGPGYEWTDHILPWLHITQKDIRHFLHTHTHTLRKSLHPRLHQSSPVADELPSSPRLITSLLSLAANQAQRRERGRDSEVEKQWSLSLLLFPLHFQFSLIFLSPQGEVEGGLIAREGGSAVSPHTSHLLKLEREKKKKKKVLINYPGSHGFHVPLSCGDRERRKKNEKENRKNDRKTKNNPSQTSVSSLMSVPSDKQHEAEINRNKWLLRSAVCTRVQLLIRTHFLYKL